MKIKAWIQSSDFTSKEYENVDVNKAIELFESHDWNSEFEKEKSLYDNGEESCTAGLGLVHPDGHVMHICPVSEGKNMIHYNMEKKVPFLIIFSQIVNDFKTVEDQSNEEVIDSIKKYFDDKE